MSFFFLVRNLVLNGLGPFFFREIAGILATLERFMADAEDKGNQFLMSFLSKQHTRLKGIFDRHVVCFFPPHLPLSL